MINIITIYSTLETTPHNGVKVFLLGDLEVSFKVISEMICSAEFNVYKTEKICFCKYICPNFSTDQKGYKCY